MLLLFKKKTKYVPYDIPQWMATWCRHANNVRGVDSDGFTLIYRVCFKTVDN